MAEKSPYFLPYQARWLKDKSRLKIWEKSRRIGATYVQAYEDVRDCVEKPGLPVWFSSADESAAREYVLYCEKWAKTLHAAASTAGETVLDSDRDVKAFSILFANGSRINALRSNPKAFRSKGGKVVLDEFAFHDDADALWKAAKPVMTWGYDLRILSTHNGRNCRYFRMTEDAKAGRGGWALHSTPIFTAVAEGLANRIAGRMLTETECEEWLRLERESCQDEETWQQEYCCVPVDEASAFLTYDEIGACESDCLVETLPLAGLYLGFDIGRKRDLSVIWLAEPMGDVLTTRLVKVMEKTPFAVQRQELFALLPACERACIDSTGLGMQLAEEAVTQFGAYTVEAVTFSGPVKSELAYQLKRRVDDRRLRIPASRDVREDLHGVRKLTTAAGNVRFDADRTNAGHADRFWALALSNHAATAPRALYAYESVPKKSGFFGRDYPEDSAGFGRQRGIL